jgi:hypothetical protein
MDSFYFDETKLAFSYRSIIDTACIILKNEKEWKKRHVVL